MIDVGAHTGEFSGVALTANPDLKLVLAEANPALIPNLRQRFQNARIIPSAIGERTGEVTLNVHAEHIGSSSIHRRGLMRPDFAGNMTQIPIALTTLDQGISDGLGRGAFIKIDVEGSEGAVMRGAPRTLANGASCAILFEYSFGWHETGEDLFAAMSFLWGMGFEIYRVTPLGLEHIRFFTLDMRGHQYCNYLALRNIPIDGLSLATENGHTTFSAWD